jgi:hypothetical protein
MGNGVKDKTFPVVVLYELGLTNAVSKDCKISGFVHVEDVSVEIDSLFTVIVIGGIT